MAQHDYDVANGTGSAVRSDLNDLFDAIATNNSGATSPGTTFAFQWWFDTANSLLKIRDSTNVSWVTVASLSGTTWTPYRAGAAIVDRMVLTFGHSTALAAGQTRYIGAGGGHISATEADVRFRVPFACTLATLIVDVNPAPGSGQSVTATVRKNSVDTAIAVTILDTDTAESDTSDTVNFAVGDIVSLKLVGSAGMASLLVKATLEVQK